MTKRITVMPHSRTSMRMVSHHHSSPMIDRPMNAMPVSALSAIGSASFPKRVMRLCLRARWPSRLSVRIATRKTPAVATRHHASSGWASSIQAKTGTRTMRSAVNAFGTFQGLDSGCAVGVAAWSTMKLFPDGRGRRSSDRTQLRHQIRTLAAGDHGRHQITHPEVHTRGQDLDVAVHLRALVGGASDDALLDLLDQHLHRLPDTLLRPLGDERVDEIGHPVATLLDHLQWQLSVQPRRLRTVLVGVPEHPDGIQTGAAEEVRQYLHVLLGLAGEADDDVAPDPRGGRQGADRRDQGQEGLGVTETTHPPQQGR